jgi:hypothetical protein
MQSRAAEKHGTGERFLKNRGILLTHLLIMGGIFLLMTSCPTVEDPFSEYRGLNLIEYSGFSSGDWQISYGEAAPSFDYLRFEELSLAEAGSTSGLPAGKSDYHRLELVNLFQNGDFTQTETGEAPAGWELNGPIDSGLIFETTTVLKPDAGDPMEGKVLHFKLNGLQWSAYDFKDPATGLRDGFVPSSQYFIQFDSSCQFPNLFTYTNLTITKREWSIGIDTSWEVTPFPPPEEGDARFTSIQGYDYFSIGLPNEGNNAQEGYMDNIRVGRTDIEQNIVLSVPLTDPEELRPNLIDGHYRFTFYVKLEPAGNITPGVSNRFDARSVSVSLQLSRGEDITQFQTFFSEELGWTRDEWTEINFETPKVLQFNLPEQSESAEEPLPEPALEISISPNSSTFRDIGSILVAAPSLTYHPEGFSD